MRNIVQACTKSRPQWQSPVPNLMSLRTKPESNLVAHHSHAQAPKAEGSRPVQDLLLLLGQLCFRDYDLPQPSINAKRPYVPKSFFAFRRWHIDKMRCLLRMHVSHDNEKDAARANLIPFFLILNKSLQRISYFLFDYEVDWRQVQKALKHIPKDFHYVCQVLSNGKFRKESSLSVVSLFDELPYAAIQECNAAQLKIERIVTYLKGFKKNKNYARSYQVLNPNKSVVELCLNCECKRGAVLEKGEISSALDRAYSPNHSCNDECKEERWLKWFSTW